MRRPVRRSAILAVGVVLALAIVADLRRAPAEQFTSHAAIGAIHLYQATLSPMYARMGLKCRFTMTCSHYGEECVRRFGVARGAWLAFKRVLRCGPWTPQGTVDTPPLS